MEYRLAVAQQLAVLLKSLRKQRKLTQRELGERIGMSQRMVAKLEANPDASSFARIFQALSALEVDIILRDRIPAEQDGNSESKQSGGPAW